MEPDSQYRFAERVLDKNDPLTTLGILVLMDRMCWEATGLDISVASKLAGSYIKGWVPFTAWCTQRGIRHPGMRIEELLSSVYGWLVHNCAEQKDLDKLHLRLFGRKNPW